MRTGATTEKRLSERYLEFGMINADYATSRYRYVYAASGKPG